MQRFSSMLLIVFLSGCLVEQDNPLVIPTCYDGMHNQDETDIDCGGKCAACKPPIIVPCKSTLVNGTFTFNGKNSTITVDGYAVVQNGLSYKVMVFNAGVSVEIEIYSARLPSRSAAYVVSLQHDYEEGYARISARASFEDYWATSGTVYVVKENGTTKIQLCITTLYRSGGNTAKLQASIPIR